MDRLYTSGLTTGTAVGTASTAYQLSGYKRPDAQATGKVARWQGFNQSSALVNTAASSGDRTLSSAYTRHGQAAINKAGTRLYLPSCNLTTPWAAKVGVYDISGSPGFSVTELSNFPLASGSGAARGFQNAVLSNDENLLFFVDNIAGKLIRLNLTTGVETASAAGAVVFGDIDIAADDSKVFVSKTTTVGAVTHRLGVYDASTMALLTDDITGAAITGIKVSPDGSKVAVVNNPKIQILDASSYAVLATIDYTGVSLALFNAIWSRDGNLLYAVVQTGGTAYRVRVFDVNSSYAQLFEYTHSTNLDWLAIGVLSVRPSIAEHPLSGETFTARVSGSNTEIWRSMAAATDRVLHATITGLSDRGELEFTPDGALHYRGSFGSKVDRGTGFVSE
jgi:hypothetical protein